MNKNKKSIILTVSFLVLVGIFEVRAHAEGAGETKVFAPLLGQYTIESCKTLVANKLYSAPFPGNATISSESDASLTVDIMDQHGNELDSDMVNSFSALGINQGQQISRNKSTIDYIIPVCTKEESNSSATDKTFSGHFTSYISKEIFGICGPFSQNSTRDIQLEVDDANSNEIHLYNKTTMGDGSVLEYQCDLEKNS